ncbi:MAG: Mur ligase family protein [Actinomycetota bacterium]|nr:Mur ligase family protein [Actinomycetota bacterium]
MQANVMTGHGAGGRRAARLLAGLGDPHDDLRVVHVAGTAGKGSVCAFAASVLEAHGHVVGRFLSPHAHSVLERFAVAGAPVDEARLGDVLHDVRAVERAQRDGPDGRASTFEVATVAAYELFRRQGVDYAVVETGLGGLHDATNVVKRPDKLAVITALGLDHVDTLGHTLSEIAVQKAGIFPARGRAVAVSSGPVADAVMRVEAARRRCQLEVTEPAELASRVPTGLGLALPGRHQRINAALALEAVAVLAARDGWHLCPGKVAAGLAGASLPGRFERRHFAGHPLVLDGAHNPMKLQALIDAVSAEYPGRGLVWVLGLKPDKDLDEILRLVVPVAARVVATEFGPEDGVTAVPAWKLSTTAERLGLSSVDVEPCPGDALARAVALSSASTPVMVTGSFHMVAAAGRRSD